MLLTRECDYAIRIIRALKGGDIVSVQEISQKEGITASIAYKLARKLEKSGYLKSYRGSNGGYALNKRLSQVTLYDLCQAVDKKIFICSCANREFACTQNTVEKPCRVHQELCRIQKLVETELKAKPLSEILGLHSD